MDEFEVEGDSLNNLENIPSRRFSVSSYTGRTVKDLDWSNLSLINFSPSAGEIGKLNCASTVISPEKENSCCKCQFDPEGEVSEDLLSCLSSKCDVKRNEKVLTSDFIETLLRCKVEFDLKNSLDCNHASSPSKIDSSRRVLQEALDPDLEDPLVSMEEAVKRIGSFIGSLCIEKEATDGLPVRKKENERPVISARRSKSVDRRRSCRDNNVMKSGNKDSLNRSPLSTRTDHNWTSKPRCGRSLKQIYKVRRCLAFDDRSRNEQVMARDLSNSCNSLQSSGSYEAIGGNTSFLDPVDLQGQIKQKEFEVSNLNDTLSSLRQQLNVVEDEKVSLLEKLEAFEKEAKALSVKNKRFRQVCKDLQDTKVSLASQEDRNIVLDCRVKRLEQDLNDVQNEKNTMRLDLQSMQDELAITRLKLTKNEEFIELRKEYENFVAIATKEKEELKEKNMHLEYELYNLQETVMILRNQKVDLEQIIKTQAEERERKYLSSCSVLPSPEIIIFDSVEEAEESLITTPFPVNIDPSRSIGAELKNCMATQLSGSTEFFKQGESILALIRELRMIFNCQSKLEDGENSFKRSTEKIVELSGGNGNNHEIVEERDDGKDCNGRMKGNGTEDKALSMSFNKDKSKAGDKKSSEGSVEEGHDSNQSILHEEMIRRINEELADFRDQLKKSQELFFSFKNSAQSFNMTKSCPLLAEEKEEEQRKGTEMTCSSTQTDSPVINTKDCAQNVDVIELNGFPAPPDPSSLNDHENYFIPVNEVDSSYDKLSDEIRLTINLPTVPEESEEADPNSLVGGIGSQHQIYEDIAQDTMASEKRGRSAALIRMANVAEEDLYKQLGSDQEDHNNRSEGEFESAVSSIASCSSHSASVYHSLDRPLQVTSKSKALRQNGHPRSSSHKDCDAMSSTSEGNTTIDSPISSPSSPTYFTPTQGSSSDETITLHDGDKTPVNEEQLSSATSSPFKSASENELRKRTPWPPSLLSDNFREDREIDGKIPEHERKQLQTYAFDPVRRNSEVAASILTPKEWRTLKHDLEKQSYDKYRKGMAQQEGNDMETSDGSNPRLSNLQDLDDTAEEYIETFPTLAQELFNSLDTLKNNRVNPDSHDLDSVSERFNQLALVFKTDHASLVQGLEQKHKERQNAYNRLLEISLHLKDSLHRMNDTLTSQRPSDVGDIGEIMNGFQDSIQELDLHFSSLSRSSHRIGMIDIELRTFKLIEVMTLYVHILRNRYDNTREEFSFARELLKKNDIPFTRGNKIEDSSINNNNHDKTWWNQSQSKGTSGSEKEETIFGPHFADWNEVLRRELHWPWERHQTWKGLKNFFSATLMVLGILVKHDGPAYI